jgi:hypothetical protein
MQTVSHVFVSSMSIGGLAGDYSGKDIKNSYMTGTVKAESSVSGTKEGTRAGGLVGFFSNGATMENCYASGDVYAVHNGSGSNYVVRAGGLAGQVEGGDNRPGVVKKSYAAGKVSAESKAGTIRAGGITGRTFGSIEITDSYATGAVSATSTGSAYSYAGGIAGDHDGGSNEEIRRIERCYATGTISATGGSEAGGIRGGNSSNSNAVINACTALSASITGSAGSVYRIASTRATTLSGNIADSAMTLSGGPSIISDPAGVHGESKTAAQLESQATYEALGWDFTATWKMQDGRPVLRWQ